MTGSEDQAPGGPTGLSGVTVTRGAGVPVLRDVTLLAEPGELLAVIGPSGSGKTTALRAVAGLVPVTSGEVLVGGSDVRGVPTQDRRLAMVFETTALWPFLDVEANLTFGMHARRASELRIQERLFDRSALFGLRRLLPRRPGGLSAGERGRVGIGRAMIDDRAAYLFDEPLAHLDAPDRLRTRRLIADLVHRSGSPALYVTHDQSEALAIGDRIAVLRAGEVVQTGTGHELYERPVDLFVASFVGTPALGLLPARLVEGQGQAGFTVGGRTLPLWRPVPGPLAGRIGSDVVLGLRPEDVTDASAGRSTTAVVLPGTATAVERLGAETVVTAAVDAHPVTAPGADRPTGARAELHARFPARARVQVGDRLQLSVDASRALVFDAATGRALWHADPA